MAIEDDDFGKVGQDKIIAVVRRLVDGWRGLTRRGPRPVTR